MTVGKALEARPTCPGCDAVDRLMGLIRGSHTEYEIGSGDGFAAKDFTITNTVICKVCTNVDNVEVAISPP